MAERGRRYQHNICMIREAGCPIPTPAMVDTLDPAEIELWFADGAFFSHRLKNATSILAAETDDPDDA